MTDLSVMYAKYSPEVFRFALYLSGNRADAEDITSETFVRAWTAVQPLEMATVKGYLLTIARNLFLQQLRKASRARALDEDIRDPSPGPELEAERKAAYSAVMDRLQQLPELDRAALLMSAFEGVPYGDIARALGISLPAVKMKIHRARLALSQLEHPK
ncbi:RNA polymerase sigma factor [Paludibaculum fermentans]|uniref:RNA polymerase sigma factor n=1 Tax=Paludibaculum fermentans TaxID=1473598 RepID=A0A7S7NPA1_PALFE|nr:RNA polymerase sigma factor [Paludibaculum fermentans]QOY87214.1 RNA polymerase sigma factor [Paludibaculum fermentans]